MISTVIDIWLKQGKEEIDWLFWYFNDVKVVGVGDADWSDTEPTIK